MMRALAAILLLTGIAAAAAPPRADEHEKSADSGDKTICKRFTETGSLVKSRRICKTKREWEIERDALRTVNNSNSCGSLGNGGVCN